MADDQTTTVATDGGSVPAGSTSTALTVLDVRNKLLDPRVRIAEAGHALLALAVEPRALAVANAFNQAVDAAGAEGADAKKEAFGRKLERTFEEMPDDAQQDTLEHMIREGDTEVVLAMVRGQAGMMSSTAERLTAELITELFNRDPDMNAPDRRRSRLLTICWTLIAETAHSCAGVNQFFASRSGQARLRQLVAISSRGAGEDDEGGDEDADEILRLAAEREIPIPRLCSGEVENAEAAEPDDEAGQDEED